MSELRQMRKERGITPLQLAVAANVTEQTIWRWERHGLPDGIRLDKAEALSKALGVPLSFFTKSDQQ